VATLKVVLKKDKNKDGSYPLVIRITKDRKTTFIKIGHNIKVTQWDSIAQKVKKSHPNSTRLNNLISNKFTEAQNKLLELEANKQDLSSVAIKSSLKGSKHSTFNKQSAIYLEQLKKSGKFNRWSADGPRVKRFQEFIGNADITFSEIDIPLIRRFKTHLKVTRSITERTIMNHLVVLRSIFSQAIDAKVVDEKYYPFGKGKILIKLPESNKIGLDKDEVEKLENLELKPGSKMDHGRNVWLFAFYFAGMRAGDVLRLKWSDFQNQRLYYTMGKNMKPGSLKTPVKALAIIEKYKRENVKHDLVFPDLEAVMDIKDRFEVEKKINQKVKLLDEGLAEVAKEIKLTKKLTMHISRHTFGNISGDKIHVQMLQKLYRHTHISTTIGYQGNFIHKDADEALEAVIGN
jgi:integrase/recombinase XerD